MNDSESEINMEKLSQSLLVTSVEQLLFGAIFIVTGFCGVIGNLLVLVALTTSAKMMRNKMNIAIINLATGDLFTLLLSIPEIILALRGEGWILPSLLCPLLRYLEEAFLYVSVFMQLIVCIERFLAVSHPISQKAASRIFAFSISIACAWIACFALATPYAFSSVIAINEDGSDIDEDTLNNTTHPLFDCYLPDEFQHGFKITEHVAFYIVPCALIGSLYGAMAWILWRQTLQLNALQQAQRSKSSTENIDRRLKARKEVVKMFGVTVAIYFLCYSPTQTTFVCHLLDLHFIPTTTVLLTFNALTYSCSAVNPIVYMMFSKRLRSRLSFMLSQLTGPTTMGEKERRAVDIKLQREVVEQKRQRFREMKKTGVFEMEQPTRTFHEHPSPDCSWSCCCWYCILGRRPKTPCGCSKAARGRHSAERFGEEYRGGERGHDGREKRSMLLYRRGRWIRYVFA